MHQPTLVSFLRGPSAPAEDVCTESLECYDFFCGCGGWSTGATQAGHRVVFACDNNEGALAAHAANHPDTTHLQASLPLPLGDLPFPTDGRKFHVHGSPPCQLFSKMKTTGSNRVTGRKHAIDLVRWYLETALASGCSSWSMEQVPSKIVLETVEEFRLKHRARMDYGVFDFYDLGVPQHRKRLLAGSPALIARLKRMRSHSRRRSVRDVLTAPRGTHIRHNLNWEKARLRHNRQPGESKYVYTKSENPMWGCFSIKGPAPTVVSSSIYWATDGDESRTAHTALTVEELAALQCYPDTYKFPKGKDKSQLLVGNSVPPLVARLMMGASA